MHIDGEVDTKHVKRSSRRTPTKANHKHEYFRYVTFNYIRKFDGRISDKKHKLYTRDTCIDCGHQRNWQKDTIEIEVTPKEFNKLREASKQ